MRFTFKGVWILYELYILSMSFIFSFCKKFLTFSTPNFQNTNARHIIQISFLCSFTRFNFETWTKVFTKENTKNSNFFFKYLDNFPWRCLWKKNTTSFYIFLLVKSSILIQFYWSLPTFFSLCIQTILIFFPLKILYFFNDDIAM